MKDSYVLDTMALILYLEKRKLSDYVKSIFKDAESKILDLYIPTMVLAEIGYLSEKKRIDTTLKHVSDYCRCQECVQYAPISSDIIYKSFEIDDIPELHDRIIAGTAYTLKTRLITNDSMIQLSQFVSTIW